MLSISKFIKRKIFPQNLLSRFMLIITVPILIGQLLAVYLFYERHWYNVSHHTSTLLVSEILQLINSQEYKTDPNKNHGYINLNYIFRKNINLIKPTQTYSEEFEIFTKVLNEKITYKNSLAASDPNRALLNIQIGDDLLQIKLPYKSLLNPTTDIFVIWICGLTILLIAVSLIFSKNQIKSILELANAADSYGNGYNIDYYKPTGSKEVRRAGIAFLKMKNRIERDTAKRTQMLAMISHDLKTPLTRMKLQVELMNDSEEKEELSHDITSMQQMISSYLDFVRGEGGEKFITVNVNEWISNYVSTKHSKDDIELRLDKSNIYTQIKPYAFERAIANIVSNGLKYGTKMIISTNIENDRLSIYLEDNGSGIEEKYRKLVFKPFFRTDQSRALESFGNVGLGLAITKEIISGHYGEIRLKSSEELKGLLVKIQLPTKK